MKKCILRKSLRNFFILMLIVTLSTCVGFYLQRKENFVNTYIDVTYKTVDTTEIYTASMIMGGDALISSTIANNYKKSSGYDFTNMLKNIKPIISSYDLAYYNQETILGGSSLGVSGYPQFNSPQEVGTAFVDAGFNLVSLATNHTLDNIYRFGLKAITNSRNFWDQQDGVLAVGSYTSEESRDEVVVKEINGITYGLLSYTVHTNGLSVPTGKAYVVNVYNETQVKKDVLAYRDKVDVLMVSMHWGEEYTHTPVNSQKNIAKYLASLGVDLIIGTHPHVIEPITFIDDTLVIYSLGNLVSTQVGNDRLIGLLASTIIEKKVYHGKTTISFKDVTGELIYTDKSNKSMVYPFSMLNNNILSGYKNYYTQYSKYVTSYSNLVTVKGL